jgi:hypothetical protein
LPKIISVLEIIYYYNYYYKIQIVIIIEVDVVIFAKTILGAEI